MKEQLLTIIEQSFAEINETREQDKHIPFSENAALYGPSSLLDSVDLVNLLLAIEERIEDEMDITFTIASEKALSLKHSPFKSVSSLCTYLLDELG